MSSLTDALRRSSEALKLGASSRVSDYEQRFSSLKNLYGDLLADLVRADFGRSMAYEAATQFFGDSIVRFAGVDGTMYSRPLFDMVVFFGGAYASTGTVTFTKDGEVHVEYDRKTLKQNAGISSVVPVYINEVADIDKELPPEKQPLTDEAIADNSMIANRIMTLAEYYLAYKLATDPSQNTRIILMDRSLSTERASLLYDTSDRENWKTKANIVGYQADGQTIDVNDLTIARQCICNATLNLPPPRADYLRYAIIQAIKTKGPLKEGPLLAELDISDEKRTKRARRYIKRWIEEDVLTETAGQYSLNNKYTTSWSRIKKMMTNVGDKIFIKQETQTNTDTLKIVKEGKEHWLTTTDIAFLTLFTLQMLMEECWKKQILLIGITKDTAARDFKRQLIPIMQTEDLLKTTITRETFEKLPDTDRMILQSTSLFNPDKMKPPWSLIEYDSAFRTMIPDRKGRAGYVSGAIKNKISLERVFVKTYVQLSQAKSDPMLRSNVLLIDRLVYPECDCKAESIVRFWNELSDGSKEPVEAVLFRDKSVSNRLQDLTMSVLVAMAPSSIPEAFGHNKPLFIADKIAKWNYGQFKCVVDTTASWILNNHKLRRFIFYMSTFRERRASIEAARRE